MNVKMKLVEIAMIKPGIVVYFVETEIVVSSNWLNCNSVESKCFQVKKIG